MGLVPSGRSTGLDDNGAGGRSWGLSPKYLHRWNPALSIRDRPDVKNDDAVALWIDQHLDPPSELHAVLSPHQTIKYAVLQRATEGLRELVHRSQAFSVSDVIGQYIGARHRSARHKWGIGRNVALNRPGEKPRLDVDRSAVG